LAQIKDLSYINNILASHFFKKTFYSITYKTLIIKGFAFDLFPGEHLPIPAINLLRKFICENRTNATELAILKIY
jgi:hypothetical protein